jgi:S1-C subfamily serine protease
VIEPWYFFDKEDATAVAMNKIVNNGGKITAYFTAYSPDRTSMKFTTSSFSVNRDADEIFSTTDNDGNSFVLRKAKLAGGSDWAVAKTNKTGKISIDYQLSTNLKQQQKLHVLGYPLGLGVNSAADISPIYGSCIVSKEGLESGIILTTDRNFEHGNSGGPVFYLDNNSGRYIAVGIVSSTAGGSTGIITPISSIR